MIDIVIGLVAFAAALVLLPAALLMGASMLASILLDDAPETFLSDPARRSFLRG